MDVNDAKELLQHQLHRTRDALQPSLASYRQLANGMIANAIENLDNKCAISIDAKITENFRTRQFLAELLAISLQADGFTATINSHHSTDSVSVIISGW